MKKLNHILSAPCLILGLVLAFMSLSVTAQSEDDNEPEERPASAKTLPPMALGWIENIRIMPDRMLMRAKLDSGAKSNAMHASDMEFYEEDGKSMVRFSLLRDHDEEGSRTIILEKEVQRSASIKLRYTPVRDIRPVVLLDFCIAGNVYKTEFTLTNRADFNYPVLLGRDFLQGHFLIDPSETYTHRTRCPRS